MPGLVRSPTPSEVSDLEEEVTDLRSPPPPEEDALMRGYQDCAAEAIRYLVEEEGRAPDDPTVTGLMEHLQARSAYLEYLSLLRRLETDMEDHLGKLLRAGSPSEDQRPRSPLSEQQRHLVETVFRGCDLVVQSPTQSPPPPRPQRLYFGNNDYLDQALAWAHTP